MKIPKYMALSALLGVQQMLGNFGATDDKVRERFVQMRGVNEAKKNRSKSPRKALPARHRRRYTHGKPGWRV